MEVLTMLIVENFLTKLKVDERSKNTIDSYRFDLKLWMQYQFPEAEVTAQQLESVTIQELYSYMESIAEKSSATRSRMVSSIKGLYKYLVEFAFITNNPTIALKKIKVKSKPPVRLNENQCLKMLDSVEKLTKENKERDYAMLTLFINTGIRESELVSIDLDSINDEVLTVTGKGNKTREVPLNESCIDAINAYLKVRSKESKDKALFLTTFGTRFTRHGLMGALERYLRKFNISIHKLRHTAATVWLGSGADITTIQRLLGHEDIKTTLIYAFVTDENKKKVVGGTSLSNIKRKV